MDVEIRLFASELSRKFAKILESSLRANINLPPTSIKSNPPWGSAGEKESFLIKVVTDCQHSSRLLGPNPNDQYMLDGFRVGRQKRGQGASRTGERSLESVGVNVGE